jgi:DNA-binding CsgD family transcriptional regulator
MRKEPTVGEALRLPLADVGGFAQAVNAIGTPRFADGLIKALLPISVIDQIAVVAYERASGPRTLCVASRNNPSLARSLTRDYVTKHYDGDPILEQLARRRWSKGIAMFRHDPSRLKTRAYEIRFFKSVGLVDKIAYAWWAGETAYYVNLYRFAQTGRFQERDLAILEGLRDLIAAMVRLHDGRRRLRHLLHGRKGAAHAMEFVALLGDRLTAREQQVLAALLRGTSSEGIAAALSLKPSTVVTYRKRAYAKLGIATQAELFALCLEALPEAL